MSNNSRWFADFRRWALRLGLVVAALVGCGAGGLTWLGRQPLTLLVLGSDARRPGEAGRSDTIIVFRLDPQEKSARALSLPRDLYVELHGLPFPATNRINAALFLGDHLANGRGLRVAKQTVEALLGSRVDGVMVFEFPTIARCVDALGGVEVYVEHLVMEHTSRGRRVRFTPGWNYLNGRRALEFVRVRKPGMDFARIARQQQLLEALRRAVLEKGVRNSIMALWPHLRGVRTDLSLLGWVHAVAAAAPLSTVPIAWRSLKPEELQFVTTENGAQVLRASPETVAGLRAFLRGEHPSGVRYAAQRAPVNTPYAHP